MVLYDLIFESASCPKLKPRWNSANISDCLLD